MNEILALISGILAPFITRLLTKFGLTGVVALWVSYAISVALAVVANLLTGTINWSDITATITIIVATSQTIFHALKPRDESNI